MKKKAIYLSEDITTQYPLAKFTKLIELSVDLVENFLIMLEDGFDYDSTTLASYSMKYTSNVVNTSSKVETLYIKNLKQKEDIEKFLYAYYTAYNFLNEEEQNMFNATFIDHLNDTEIMVKYDSYYDKITRIRRSAIVRFCLKSGLNKFIDLV